jgi:hypothetical protein
LESEDYKRELTYNELLSIFVVNFNYSIEDFDLLTLAQAELIMQRKLERDKQDRFFLQNEFRANNFYSIRTGTIKRTNLAKLKTPMDLYPLEFDEHYKKKSKKAVVLNDDIDFIFKQTGLRILSN